MLLKYTSALLFVTAIFASHGDVVFGQSGTVEKHKSDTAEKDSTDEKLQKPITSKAISKLIEAKKFDEAAEMIDAGIAQAGPDGDRTLTRQRSLLARGYGQAREFAKAYSQGEKYIRELVDQSSTVGGVNAAVSNLSRTLRNGNRVGEADAGFKLVMDVLAKAEALTSESPKQYISVMQRLVPMCAEQAVASGDEEKAKEILTEQIAAIDALKVDDSSQIDYLITKTKLLQSRAKLPSSLEGPAADLKKFIDEANAAHPDSIPLLTAYMRAETFMIGEMVNNYPHEAQVRVEALRELVGDRKNANGTLRSMPGTLGSCEMMIKDTLKLEAMIGTKAPEFEVETWINGGETPLKSLKGKVILLDFWAVWCGPCIEAFPHMVEMQNEFKDDGLAVLGVTQCYDYRWNEEKKAAFEADDDVPLEEEIADIKKFVAHHQLNYPVIVAPEGGKMQEDYAAYALPHVVIIDREGNIQLARVGAGKGAFEQIYKKLKEVLKE